MAIHWVTTARPRIPARIPAYMRLLPYVDKRGRNFFKISFSRRAMREIGLSGWDRASVGMDGDGYLFVKRTGNAGCGSGYSISPASKEDQQLALQRKPCRAAVNVSNWPFPEKVRKGFVPPEGAAVVDGIVIIALDQVIEED